MFCARLQYVLKNTPKSLEKKLQYVLDTTPIIMFWITLKYVLDTTPIIMFSITLQPVSLSPIWFGSQKEKSLPKSKVTPNAYGHRSPSLSQYGMVDLMSISMSPYRSGGKSDSTKQTLSVWGRKL